MGEHSASFCHSWQKMRGDDLDFTAVDPDELMIATIYAAQGIEAPLQQAFEKIVQNEE